GMPARLPRPRPSVGPALWLGLAACDAKVRVGSLPDAGIGDSGCLPLNAGCSSDGDCCSGDCDSDRCASPGAWGLGNAACGDETDCCPGLTCGCKGFLCTGTNTCCLSVTSDTPCTDVSQCCGTLARGCRYDFVRQHLACCNWVSEPCLSDADCCPPG